MKKLIIRLLLPLIKLVLAAWVESGYRTDSLRNRYLDARRSALTARSKQARNQNAKLANEMRESFPELAYFAEPVEMLKLRFDFFEELLKYSVRLTGYKPKNHKADAL